MSKIYIDPIEYKKKPTSSDTASINKRIMSHKRKVTPEELREAVTNGKSVILGTFVKDNVENRLYKQGFVAIDVDNKDTDYIFTIDDAKADSFIRNNALFLYTTFSHTEELPKFRIVFKLSTEQSSKDSVKFIYQKLFDKFPSGVVDTACVNSSRIFYGSYNGYVFTFNDMNRLNIEKLISDTPKSLSHEPINKNVPTWKLMKYHSLEADMAIKERWESIVNDVVVRDSLQAEEFMKSLNMCELLGLPDKGKFIDIIDGEDDPSASVFLFENKIWLYHRFNKNDNHNIITLVSTLRGLGRTNAVSYLANLLNIQFDINNKFLNDVKDAIDKFRFDILALDLQKLNPSAFKFLKDERSQRGSVISCILDILRYNVIIVNNRPELISALSVRELSMRIFGNDKGKNRIAQNLKVMNILGIIKTLDADGIPKDMLDAILEFQKDNNYSKRLNVHQVTGMYHDLTSTESNRVFDTLVAKGINSRSLTKEGISLTLGKDKADELYVQDKDRDISRATRHIQDTAIKYILTQINKHGYIEESKVIDYLIINTNYSKYKVTNVIKKSRVYFKEGYNIKFDRLNKELKNELNIFKYKHNERPMIYFN